MERLFNNFYPTTAAAASDGNADIGAEAAEAEADPEIAALEAQLAALRKSKAAAAAGGPAVEVVPNGAAFRDALLVVLGSNKLSAAQLQSFFVTHRKCTATEAIADVGSIVKAIEQRAQEEAAKVATQAPEAAVMTNTGAPEAVQGQSGRKAQHVTAAGPEARAVHVHIHTSDQP